MAAFRTISGRIGKKRTIAIATAVASVAALLLATEVPSALLPLGGGSAALAELVARSPGARVGGVALKAKQRRASYSPIAGEEGTAGPDEGAPRNPLASVLGASAGPEGGVPGSEPLGPGGFPSDFTAPDVPNPLDSVSSPSGTTGSSGFENPAFPSVGGAPIFAFGSAPGGGGAVGGGSGGGDSGVAPTPTPTPTEPAPNPTETPPVPQPTDTLPSDTLPVDAGPIPEPSTWLLLIGGFGMVGSTLRRKRRVALA